MRVVVEPLLPSMGAFDRWARRLGLADSGFRSEEALSEAAFAPLRQEPQVRAAWVVREGPDARALRYPDDAPDCPTEGWILVRTESLGDLHAQRRSLPIEGAERELILIRRSLPSAGGAVLHVTLAYGAVDDAVDN